MSCFSSFLQLSLSNSVCGNGGDVYNIRVSLPYQINLVLLVFVNLCFPFSVSASMSNMAKIEEMELLLREAQAEKQRLLEHRVMCQILPKRTVYMDVCLMIGVIYSVGHVQEREMEMRRQALEDERRRREELEKRLQEETSRRQKLVEREVKLREKQRSQVFRETEEKTLTADVFWQFASCKYF